MGLFVRHDFTGLLHYAAISVEIGTISLSVVVLEPIA
jgi:hypothetical protein